MKRGGQLGVVVSLLALLAVAARAQASPNTAFDMLKSLVGTWEGKTSVGQTVMASYRLASNGSAVMETLDSPDSTEMVTIYHLDGERVAMTHFCSAGNQPRMRAAAIPSPVRRIVFEFLDVTNLANPADGRMQRLEIEFQDPNHFAQRWTWRENGRDQTETFQFTRRK